MLEGLLPAVSSGLTTIVAFLVVLTIVVFVHEYGHFIVARWCGVKVSTFSIGFGRELWSRVDSKGTRWRIAAVPLGGYVKFLDDANAASGPSEERLKQLSPEERSGAFQLKPLWKRAAIVFAGPFANFLLAAAIYTLINLWVGVRTIPPVIDTVVTGLPAEKAGLATGDRILSVDGQRIDSFDEALRIVATTTDRPVEIEVARNGERLTKTVTPVVREVKDSLGVALRLGDIGIRSHAPPRIGEVQADLPAAKAGFRPGDVVKSIDGAPIASFEDLADIVNRNANRPLTFSLSRDGRAEEIAVTPVSKPRQDPDGKVVCVGRIGIAPAPVEPVGVGLGEALSRGISETKEVLVQTLAGLRDLVFGRQPLSQVGGPILMAEVTARALDYGLERVLTWMAFFSANIGLLNLLPIPLLDGGHLLFYALEAVRRKPLSPAVQEIWFRLGLALVVTIMVIAFSNDIGRKLGLGAGDSAVVAEPKC